MATAATAFESTTGGGPELRPSFTAIRHVTGDPDAAAPVAVSDDGSIVVANGASLEGREAFRWTSATGAVGLGDLPGGLYFSEASHASRDGAVIVGKSSAASEIVPFRWTAARGLEPLLPDADRAGCVPTALTPDGATVVLQCASLELDPFPAGRCALVVSEARGVERIDTGARYVDVSHDGAVLVGLSDAGVVRRERGADGAFGTDDDSELIVAPSAFFLALGDPSMSGDGRTIVSPRSGILLDLTGTIRWSVGPDGLAGTPDDVSQSIGARDTRGTRCEALGLSDDGTTAFGRCSNAGAPYPARWTARSGWTRLVTSPPSNVTAVGAATATSADGSAIAGWMEDATTSPWGSQRQIRSFRWTAKGGASFFPKPGRVAVDRERVVLSSSGTALLGPEWTDRGQGLFLWRSGRGRTHVDDLPDGPSAFESQRLSADGSTIVGVVRSSLTERVALWRPSSVVLALGPSASGDWQTHVSASGHVVIGSQSGLTLHDVAGLPFRWKQSTGAASNLVLPKPFPGCWVEHVSKSGTAFAGMCRSGSSYWSFFHGAGVGTMKVWGNCDVQALSADGSRVVVLCGSRAFVWSPPQSGARPMENWLIDFSFSAVHGMSDDGRRVLLSGGVLWTDGIGLRWDLVPADARGLQLSADGSTILWRSSTDYFRYRDGVGSEVVPRPAGSALTQDSVAFLSADGRVVVGSDPPHVEHPEDPTPPPSPRVWVSDPVHGARWLDEILTLQAGEDLSGWELEIPIGISDDGTRIAGTDRDALGIGTWYVIVPDLAAPTD